MWIADAAASPVLDFVLPFIPWLAVLVFLYFAVFRHLGRERARVAEVTDRSRKHQAALEAKLDRIVELLERRSPPPSL